MKKNIYIPIEITHRELLPRLYISYLLAKKGYRVYIGSKIGVFNFIKTKKIKEGIFFYKSAFSQEDKSKISFHNTKEITNLIKNCEHTVVLDEEMGIGMGYEPITIEQRITNLNYISKFFLIGKRLKEIVKKKNQKHSYKFINTGWPKYDLNKKKYRNFYNEEAKKIKKQYGDFYLFSSNFGFLNKFKLDERLAKIKNKGVKYNNLKIVYKNAYKDYLNFVNKVNNYSKNSQLKIIIRPHPSDRTMDNWYNDVRESDFIKIIYKNDIIPWILASKGLIHRGCSTSIDAYMLEKEIFYLQPNRKLRNFEKNIPYKISKKINNFNDILKLRTNKNKINKKLKSFLKYNISNLFDLASSDEIIKQLNSLKVKKIKKVKPRYLNIIKMSFFEIFRKAINIFKFQNYETNQKMPFKLSQKMISDHIFKLFRKKNFVVKKIDFETYEIFCE